MMTSVLTGISNLGGKVSRVFSDRPHNGVGKYGSTHADHTPYPLAKRPRLSSSENRDARWIAQGELNDILAEYSKFRRQFRFITNFIRTHSAQFEMNNRLLPLLPFIADNEEDFACLNTETGRDLSTLFILQIQNAFQQLDKIYTIGRLVKIREKEPLVPESLNYSFTADDVDILARIQNFMSAPQLPEICGDVLQGAGRQDEQLLVGFMDRVVLDIKAMMCGFPIPSFVVSVGFHESLRLKLLPCFRSDPFGGPILPGSFPESDGNETLPSKASATSSALGKPLPLRSLTAPLAVSHERQSSADKKPIPASKRLISNFDDDLIMRSEIEAVLKKKKDLRRRALGKLKSALKSQKANSLHNTPKRLGVRREPMPVRFTDFSPSPHSRTHSRTDVPRIFKDVSQRWVASQSQKKVIDPSEPSSFLQGDKKQQIGKEVEDRGLTDAELREYFTKQSLRSDNIKTVDFKKRERRPSQTSIDDLFALPSEKQLEINDNTRYKIERKKEQLAVKAAKEAKKLAEENARLELKERLARTGGLRLPRQNFISTVSPQWMTRAQSTLRAAALTTLATTGENVELKRHDFAKVVPPTEWLNDEIVNGTLNWLDKAINTAAGIKDPKTQTRKCLALSSFFMKRLQDQGVTKTQRTLRRSGIEKNNFLDVETILLPICERSHWTLLVIRPPKRTVAHMDSLNPRGSPQYTKLALAWIKDVLEEKFDGAEWKVARHDAPMQTNGYDCGVHTITNGMCVALGLNPIDTYAAKDMPLQRIRIACMFLNGGFRGDFDLCIY